MENMMTKERKVKLNELKYAIKMYSRYGIIPNKFKSSFIIKDKDLKNKFDELCQILNITIYKLIRYEHIMSRISNSAIYENEYRNIDEYITSVILSSDIRKYIKL